MLKIRVMNISKSEVAKTLKKFKGTAWDQSPLFKKLYEEGQYPSVRRVKTLLGKCPLHRINISCVIKAAKRDLNAAPSASE